MSMEVPAAGVTSTRAVGTWVRVYPLMFPLMTPQITPVGEELRTLPARELLAQIRLQATAATSSVP